MNLKNNDLVFYISIKQLEMLSENFKTNEIRFSFITLCDYYLRSSPPFHVMGPSFHRTSPVDNIRRIGPYTIP